MNVVGNSEAGHFFSAIRNAAEKVVHSDPCQVCFNGLRSVKVSLASVFCPEPPTDYPADMTQPLLNGYVTDQPGPDPKWIPIEQTWQNHPAVSPDVDFLDPKTCGEFYESFAYQSLPPLPDVHFPEEE